MPFLSFLLALDKPAMQVPGVVSASQLPVLLGAVQDELGNSEWAVRKAAAEALSCMASAVGNSLVSYRAGVIAALESSRFDKVNTFLSSLPNFKNRVNFPRSCAVFSLRHSMSYAILLSLNAFLVRNCLGLELVLFLFNLSIVSGCRFLTFSKLVDYFLDVSNFRMKLMK